MPCAPHRATAGRRGPGFRLLRKARGRPVTVGAGGYAWREQQPGSYGTTAPSRVAVLLVDLHHGRGLTVNDLSDVRAVPEFQRVATRWTCAGAGRGPDLPEFGWPLSSSRKG